MCPVSQLRIVQPDIPQREKDSVRIFYARNWQRLLDLSAQPVKSPSGQSHHMIIWPEAAPPPFMFNAPIRRQLDEISLLTGGRTAP